MGLSQAGAAQCAHGHPQQERVFGRPGDIREKLYKQASALPSAGPAESCCGEHDHEHPRQRHGMGRSALHCWPGNFWRGSAQELLLGFLRAFELEVNALYPTGHETAE